MTTLFDLIGHDLHLSFAIYIYTLLLLVPLPINSSIYWILKGAAVVLNQNLVLFRRTQ